VNRTLSRLWLGVVLCSALIVGSLLAQNYTSGSTPASGSTPTSDQTTETAAPPTYKPVSVETLGTTTRVARLAGSDVSVADFFYGWVTVFPDDALRLRFSPQEYVAFRTQPFGSNLVCFVPIGLADLAALQDSNPVRGTEIFLMGRVFPRILAADGVATAFQVDRVILGHEAPLTAKQETKKSVVVTVEKVGPDGVTYRQKWTIKTPGEPFWLPDPSDPNNDAKKLRVTLQF